MYIRSQARFLGASLYIYLFSVFPAGAETLPEAVASALNQNPTLEQVVAVQKQAQEDLKIEKSNFYPTVSFSTAVGRVYGDNATSRGLSVTRGAGYSNLWEGSLTVNQMIFDGLRTPLLVDAAKTRMGASEEALRATRESLVLQTSLSYLNILRIRQSLHTLDAHAGKIMEYESKIENMVKESMADETELQQAKALALELKGLIAEFRGQELAAQSEFTRLTGHAPEFDMFKPLKMDDHFPVVAEDALQFALQVHPQVKMVEKEIEASKLMTKAENASLYPNVTGELSQYRKDVEDVIGGEVEDSRAVVRLNWSISAGGAEQARIKRAHLEEDKTEAKKNEILRNLESIIRSAYADLMTASEKEKLSAQELKTHEELLKAYKAQFEGGKVRVLQLLQQENEFLSARLDNVNAEYRELAAQFSVLGSLGQIQNALAFNGATAGSK